MKPDREARFVQPAGDIEVVSRAGGPRTLLTPEALEDGRRRIAAGEDPDAVASDLAAQELALLEGDPEESATVRVALESGQYPMLRVVDAQVPALAAAAGEAFAAARLALEKDGAEAAVAAQARALAESMPLALHRALAAGGRAAAGDGPRAAGEAEGHPFRGNQWVSGTGAVLGRKGENFVKRAHEPDSYGSHHKNIADPADASELFEQAHAALEKRGYMRDDPSGLPFQYQRDARFTHPAGGRARLSKAYFAADPVYKAQGHRGSSRVKLELEEPRSAAGRLAFDAKDSEAVRWTKAHAAELVTEVTKVTRERIKAAVVDHQSGKTTDKEFAKALTKAVGDADRADLIARTESMIAVHQGQREAWKQSRAKGLLGGGQRRAWIVTDDELLCPVCNGLDGATAGLDGTYPGGYDGPPAHPRCRCTEGLG